MSEIRRIAFLTQTPSGYMLRLSRGVYAHADEVGSWTVRIFPLILPLPETPPLQHALATLVAWKPDGIISTLMDGELTVLRTLIGTGVPQVNLIASTPRENLAVVTGSHRNVIATAVRTFRSLQIREPAFLCLESGAAVKNLHSGIIHALPQFDRRRLLVLPVDRWIVEDPSASVVPIPAPLRRWIASLERPAGILCVTLMGGDYLMRVMRELDLRIPDDMSIIGMDDPDVCLSCEPSLTSVTPSAERVGYEGAQILQSMIQRQARYPDTIRVESVDVAIRHSTRVCVNRCDIAAALAFIDQHAVHGISVDEVVARTQHVSRMTFYKEFLKTTGRSPGAVIRDRQMVEACRLLEDSDIPVTQIAVRCGFATSGSFARLFRRIKGYPPSAHRQRVRPG